MNDAHPVDRLFDALSSGDADAARRCLTPDATVWHSFDRITQNPDEAARDWAAMIAVFPERRISDVRRQQTARGFVQQHLWVARTASGKVMAWPVCMVVETDGNLISRIEEYIDRAGSFTPDE